MHKTHEWTNTCTHTNLFAYDPTSLCLCCMISSGKGKWLFLFIFNIHVRCQNFLPSITCVIFYKAWHVIQTSTLSFEYSGQMWVIALWSPHSPVSCSYIEQNHRSYQHQWSPDSFNFLVFSASTYWFRLTPSYSHISKYSKYSYTCLSVSCPKLWRSSQTRSAPKWVVGGGQAPQIREKHIFTNITLDQNHFEEPCPTWPAGQVSRCVCVLVSRASRSLVRAGGWQALVSH